MPAQQDCIIHLQTQQAHGGKERRAQRHIREAKEQQKKGHAYAHRGYFIYKHLKFQLG